MSDVEVMEVSPVVGLMATPKSSSRLRELVSPHPLPWVHSSPRWMTPVTGRMLNDAPPSTERASCTDHGALPFLLGCPIFLGSLLLPDRLVPYQPMSTRPLLPPA